MSDCEHAVAIEKLDVHVDTSSRGQELPSMTGGKLLCPGGYRYCTDAERFCNRVQLGHGTQSGGGHKHDSMLALARQYVGVYSLVRSKANSQRPVWKRERDAAAKMATRKAWSGSWLSMQRSPMSSSTKLSIPRSPL